LKIFKEIIRIENNTINIRLAGDSVTGNFALGVFQIKSECYESLRKALKELIDLLSLIDETELDGAKYKIVFWSGGDLNFLALALGN